jgi:protein-tyrosine phosphatase
VLEFLLRHGHNLSLNETARGSVYLRARGKASVANPPINVLFVCTGNICRSPSAEGVFLNAVRVAGLADRIAAESAGLISWHVGDPPDPRSQAAARQRGIDIARQRARLMVPQDFQDFEYIVAMDRGHLDELGQLCPAGAEDRIRLMLDFAETPERDVPDPYYGGGDGFEIVLDLLEDASRGLLADIRKRHFETS